MDLLHAEVLFPNMQVGPRLWRTIADDDVYRATVRAYNDWLGEEYCAVSRDRLIGLGVIPWTKRERCHRRARALRAARPQGRGASACSPAARATRRPRTIASGPPPST